MTVLSRKRSSTGLIGILIFVILAIALLPVAISGVNNLFIALVEEMPFMDLIFAIADKKTVSISTAELLSDLLFVVSVAMASHAICILIENSMDKLKKPNVLDKLFSGVIVFAVGIVIHLLASLLVTWVSGLLEGSTDKNSFCFAILVVSVILTVIFEGIGGTVMEVFVQGIKYCGTMLLCAGIVGDSLNPGNNGPIIGIAIVLYLIVFVVSMARKLRKE